MLLHPNPNPILTLTLTLTQERRPQLQTLEEWADLLAGMLVAVRAHKADHHMEGVYWLVRVLGSAFPAPLRLVHARSVFSRRAGSSCRVQLRAQIRAHS